MEEDKDFDFEVTYDGLKEKYGLPEIDAIAEDFDIEKLYDKEHDFLIREIRRAINEKISGYLQLLETLINPSAPPMFVFSILKNISEKDREVIKEIYKKLSIVQIEVMKLDTVYREEAEAKFIVETFKMWQDLKLKLYGLIEGFEAGLEEGDSSNKKSYFG
ncbi:MAG: hypothetical protein OEL87_02410 [Nanoarchaeota archaeon]|nr:hypothetical protein [Nanoarchaeota archaeon]